MDLIKERNELFDSNFNLISNDVTRLLSFCQEITNITGVQVCTRKGQLYEYLPKVYKSAVKSIEM